VWPVQSHAAATTSTNAASTFTAIDCRAPGGYFIEGSLPSCFDHQSVSRSRNLSWSSPT